ncbi:hypothetical protein [Streptomyces glaucescens]|uniref:hypothetical protein n=1 Tax=Streptomyces glaucescens TaxID=1907 RepID=UPI001B808BC0|nr:hypothetical protein [Streptomyces glaucescens]
MQHHPDPLADQPHRHGVAVGADRDLAVSVDARREHPSGLERLLGQRHQQRLLDLEVLVDRSRPGPDPALAVVLVPLFDQFVQLRQRGDLGNRGEVVATEITDLPLDPALLVSAVDAGPTIEALDPDLP